MQASALPWTGNAVRLWLIALAWLSTMQYAQEFALYQNAKSPLFAGGLFIQDAISTSNMRILIEMSPSGNMFPQFGFQDRLSFSQRNIKMDVAEHPCGADTL